MFDVCPEMFPEMFRPEMFRSGYHEQPNTAIGRAQSEVGGRGLSATLLSASNGGIVTPSAVLVDPGAGYALS